MPWSQLAVVLPQPQARKEKNLVFSQPEARNRQELMFPWSLARVLTLLLPWLS